MRVGFREAETEDTQPTSSMKGTGKSLLLCPGSVGQFKLTPVNCMSSGKVIGISFVFVLGSWSTRGLGRDGALSSELLFTGKWTEVAREGSEQTGGLKNPGSC